MISSIWRMALIAAEGEEFFDLKAIDQPLSDLGASKGVEVLWVIWINGYLYWRIHDLRNLVDRCLKQLK